MSGFGGESASIASRCFGFVRRVISCGSAAGAGFTLQLLMGSGCSLLADDFEPRLVRDETLPVNPANAANPGATGGATGAAGCTGEACVEACGAECSPLIACAGDGDCPTSQQCLERQCVRPASCSDGTPNQDEADVDCGGSCALGCSLGQACRSSDDCAAGLFCPSTTRVCSVEACSDAGSACDAGCAGCGANATCADAAACESPRCEANGPCAPPSCDDGLRNQGESDVDCGGPCDRRCSTGEACDSTSDCEGGLCAAGGCAPGVASCCQAPSCADATTNGTETDADCGGADLACTRCEAGRSCLVDGDCASGACEAGRCCGGSQGDCTRCAERLSNTVDCTGAPPGGAADCREFLACLALNASACTVRFAPGCSNDPGGVCNHNTFGGDGGLGLLHVTRLIDDAGCEQ